jgi:predicted ABC-type ATPase
MNKPRLIIIAGPNGSGKTYLTAQILEHIWTEGCEYINPDNIAQEKFGDWNSLNSIIQAAQYAESRRRDCIASSRSLIFETVLSAVEKIEFVKQAKKCGYFIRLFFIGTDHPSINAARVARRVMEGGHDVPIQKIISRYFKSIKNCSVLSQLVDRLYVYDNSVDNAEAKLLFRAGERQLIKQYHPINNWAAGIFENLNH